ncbi:TPA: hypothetical protein DCQ44_01270, partial [Candidatus Taylorbacteria bacterium]|nr:hypothetical protein [Candidatus Taylorbacteria bacterium]
MKKKTPSSKSKKTTKPKAVKRIKKSQKTGAIFRKDKVVKKASPVKKFTAGEKAKNMTDKANRLLLKGRERGFVTYDEILKEFPTIEDDIVFLAVSYTHLTLP